MYGCLAAGRGGGGGGDQLSMPWGRAVSQKNSEETSGRHPSHHRRRSRGGRGGRVPPSNFSGGGSSPPSIFESLKNIFSYICILNSMKVIQKRLIQHKNTTKHTKSLNLPRASRADSRPNHISASLALPSQLA